ncbi:MAG: hypothetical protein ACI4VM_04090 [Anaerovoracaceae bacterium]
MLKKILKKPVAIILIVFFLLSAGGIAAYHIISQNFAMRSYEIISYNNLYAMSVPTGWEKSSGASKNAVIAAETPSGSMYAMMSADMSGFEAGNTLEDYINTYIGKIAASSDNPLVQVVTVEPQQMTLGENTGYYFEIDTSSGGVAVHMWDFVFNGNGGYIHVDVVSEGQDYGSKTETARNIISSARIISHG